jgi:SNF2-related domain
MPSYLVKRSAPKRPQRTRRYEIKLPPETVYLSTSTLVVVPDTLIQQWSTEILKHVQDNVLRYLTISKPTQSIPGPSELLKTDILLLSHSRFAKEDDDGRFEGYGTSFPCRCYYNSECTCLSFLEDNQTPLMRIRWKRLIIDEGHVLGQGTTRLVSLAGRLRVERRWCVTGTVSNHMMGMELGMERTLYGTSVGETGMLTPPDDQHTTISSRKPEQLDLKRLGAILIDFLHTPPFFNMEIWNRYVVRPYTENLSGSMSSLRSIMTIMIRHRPKDIERDVRLPALHTKMVLLDPTPENRLAINVITALIASNAVLTQRCDQDYFFHVSQVKARDDVVRNLMLAAFHFTGPSIEAVLESLERAETALRKAEEKGYSVDDVKLLEKVVAGLKEAVEDEGWRTMVVRERLGKEDVSSQEMGMSLSKWN